MEYTDEIREANNKLWDLMYNEHLLVKILLLSLILFCLYLVIYLVIRFLKKDFSFIYLMITTISMITWASLNLLSYYQSSIEIITRYSLICEILLIPIPALLCFHIRRQVSIKDEIFIHTIILIAVPLFLVLVIFKDIIINSYSSFDPKIDSVLWYSLLFYSYTFYALIRSYMLCFNVLFQMPRHTRRSTKLMIIGVTTLFVVFIVRLFWNEQIELFLESMNVENSLIPDFYFMSILIPLLAPICFLVMLYSMYYALNSISASEVIVTSRELVVGALTTTILILNKRSEILDWNKDEWNSYYPLPKPLYKESLSDYRNRLNTHESIRISPHNEDIVIFEGDRYESHFLIQKHDAGYNNRLFGYILEISEITPVYSILRNFEDTVYYDHLTGLHNRNAYIDMVNQIVTPENMPLVVFIGDVNKLKYVNDTFGHQLGDEVLRIVSSIIREVQPQDSFAARIGGDEFVLLIPRGNQEIADKFVQDVIALCAKINHKDYGSPNISWGYAIMNSTNQLYNDVYSEADAIMYEYKRSRHAFRSRGLVPET